MLESMTVGNVTIYTEAFTGGVVLAAMLAAYWFRRIYKRYRGQERGVLPPGIPRRRRSRYTKAEQEAIREKARRRL